MHCKEDYQVRKTECLNLALDAGKEINVDLQHLKNEIDKQLEVLEKVRQPVLSDGHCIMYSWFKALAHDSVTNSML